MKMSKVLFAQLSTMLDETIAKIELERMRHYRQLLLANPRVKNVDIRFAYDMFSFCVENQKRCAWFDACYAAGLQDSHIKTALLHYFNSRELLKQLEPAAVNAAAVSSSSGSAAGIVSDSRENYATTEELENAVFVNAGGKIVREASEQYETRFDEVPIVKIDGLEFKVRQLLQDGDSNTKLRKSSGRGFETAGLSLAPHKLAGIGNVCPYASRGCIEACLNHQGLAAVYKRIGQARQAKTVAWYSHREWFLNKLASELEKRAIHATRESMLLAARLNVFSDIQWEQFGILNAFPAVQFYDYTKNPARAGQLARNYWVTFSRSETNESECIEVLKRAGNVAVVFADSILPYVGNRSYLQQLPTAWNGFAVVDGDTTDLRFEDTRGRKHGRVIGLRMKASSMVERNQAIASGFAVQWR